jgi:hypothetical protein
MKMKRGLVFTLCAAALAVGPSFAKAQNVQLSLNLRYTDPNSPAAGGKWFLVAKTDDTDGIGGISAYLSNISATGIAYGNGSGAGASAYPATTAATIAAILNGGNPFAGTFGTAVNVVYGQDTAGGPIVADVGQGAGTPGNTATDPMKNNAWNNAAIIATGTFAGGGNAGNKFNRPDFVAVGANSTDANTLAGTTLGVAATKAVSTTTIVRGDSIISLGLNPNAASGLRPGDANRDGVVNTQDFSLLSANFNNAAAGWDQGNFNSAGGTNTQDFSILSANYNQSGVPPAAAAAVGSVPEPAGAVLLGLALLGLGCRAKRG